MPNDKRTIYFQGLKIYNHALKINYQTLKMYFHAMKISLYHASNIYVTKDSEDCLMLLVLSKRVLIT